MHEALWLALALAASCLGFACLALSVTRHWRDVTGEVALPAGRVTALRALGYLALAGSLALTLLRDGASFGSVLWVLVLTAGAATVAFTLTWRPAWLRLAVRVARVAQRKPRARQHEERGTRGIGDPAGPKPSHGMKPDDAFRQGKRHERRP